MYCTHCGQMIPEGAKFCGNCGASQADYPDRTIQQAEAALRDINTRLDHAPEPMPQMNQYGFTGPGMHYSGLRSDRCPRCGGQLTFQTFIESRKTGCFTIFLYILLCITILGILIVIPLVLRKKTETVTYAVCQSCGYRMRR